MTTELQEIAILKKALEREKKARQISEELLESKSRELYFAKEKIANQYKELEGVLEKLKEQQTMLVQSEKMASIGQLSAGIAHEINNPIGFIKSNIENFKEVTPTILGLFNLYNEFLKIEKIDSFKEKLDEIESYKEKNDINFIFEDITGLLDETVEGLDRVREIVSGLNNFSHIDEGDKLIHANINDLIDSTIKVVKNEIQYKAEIKKEYSALPSIDCYPGQLNQVFMNLIVNASQAIKELGIIIVKTSFEDDHVVIRIEDNGSGISSKNIKKLFTPFFTTKEVGDGTGLGLSISYSIVKNKHKGSIQIESEEGKGSVFSIRIPTNLKSINGTRDE